MKRYLLIKLFLFSIISVFSQHTDSSLKQIEIESKILNETRMLYISLPEQYEGEQNKYPTLYLLDGLDNYSSLASAVNILAKEEIIPHMIIVCIENTNRMRDMTPSHSNKGYYGDYNDYNKESGKANFFIKFLNQELKVYVDSAYRTNDYRILSGHSFSGLATLTALLDSQTVFDAFIAVDPSVWWDNEYIIKHTEQYIEEKSNDRRIKMYLGGTVSGPIQQKPLESIIEIYKNTPFLEFQSKIYECETHMTIPYLCNYDALKFIYSDLVIPYETIIQGKDKIQRFIKNVKSTYNIKIEFDEYFLIKESVKCLGLEQLEKATKILEINLLVFPNSLTSNLLMAESYRYMNNNEKANIYYRKVLELDPTNPKALEIIKLIEKKK